MSVVAAARHRHVGEAPQPFELGLFHYVCVFMACSIVGLAGETAVSFLIDGHWESRAGFVVGPLSPIYGLGAVLVTVAVNPLRGRGALRQFAAAALVGGMLEYFAGWFFETRYGIVAWSYADQPLNFHGHTCVGMMAVWGLIGVAWASWALPVAVNLIGRIPDGVRKPLAVIALVYIIGDSVLTVACLDSWFWRTAGYPPSNPIQQFCNAFFGDEFMRARFETMSMWTSLASR